MYLPQAGSGYLQSHFMYICMHISYILTTHLPHMGSFPYLQFPYCNGPKQRKSRHTVTHSTFLHFSRDLSFGNCGLGDKTNLFLLPTKFYEKFMSPVINDLKVPLLAISYSCFFYFHYVMIILIKIIPTLMVSESKDRLKQDSCYTRLILELF